MITLDLPPFNPVANGQRASTMVQRWQMTLGRIILVFSGTNSLTKTTITEVVVKIGARVIFGPVSAAELDKVNKHRGIYDQSDRLTIDFTERDALSVVAKEIGGIDMPALGDQDIFVEVMNNAASGTPALYALGQFTALQFDPTKPTRDGQLIRKVLGFQLPNSGATALTWMPDFKGALVQRIHFTYTGTDWSGSTNGNLQRVEAKKNGTVIHSRIQCADNRFYLQEMRKVPQSKVYCLDWVADNVHSAALDTRDARALEFNLTLGVTDTVRAIVECLDLPSNL